MLAVLVTRASVHHFLLLWMYRELFVLLLSPRGVFLPWGNVLGSQKVKGFKGRLRKWEKTHKLDKFQGSSQECVITGVDEKCTSPVYRVSWGRVAERNQWVVMDHGRRLWK